MIPARLTEIWSVEGLPCSFAGGTIWSDSRDEPVGILQNVAEADAYNISQLPRLMKALVACEAAMSEDLNRNIPGANLSSMEVVGELRTLIKELRLADDTESPQETKTS